MMRAASLLNDLSTLENEIRAKNVYIEQAELTHTGLTKELRKEQEQLHSTMMQTNALRLRVGTLKGQFLALSGSNMEAQFEHEDDHLRKRDELEIKIAKARREEIDLDAANKTVVDSVVNFHSSLEEFYASLPPFKQKAQDLANLQVKIASSERDRESRSFALQTEKATLDHQISELQLRRHNEGAKLERTLKKIYPLQQEMRQLQSKAIIRQQAADESFDAEHSMLEYELVRIKTANKKLVVFIDALLSKYDV